MKHIDDYISGIYMALNGELILIEIIGDDFNITSNFSGSTIKWWGLSYILNYTVYLGEL